VRRYFMLIPEACQLVLEAASIGTDGEVMVLEMGEQVKILEVAQTLIRMSGRRDVEVVFTGLRPGEKLGEELFSPTEERRPTNHALVDSVGVPPISVEEVRAATFAGITDGRDWMRGEALVSHAEVGVSQS
jgi:FlaA1/EpsC-like NDP-sugar epimerase